MLHASQNSQDVFGRGAGVLGATAAELLGPVAEAALRRALVQDGLTDPRPVPVAGPGAARWHGTAHCLGGLLFVELEPADEGAAPSDVVLATVRAAVGRLSAATTVSAFCAVVAHEIRALTGFDRVMVYRFDAEWNGEVVAEERHAEAEAYFGLHYPASDIPAQARALYLVNRVRVIPDATYEPVPVAPERDGLTGLPLDLSRCLTRSVSPLHREYMGNMGVRASLTASLVVGDRLWGLIACHHSTPRRTGPTEREACDLLAKVASAHLASLAESEERVCMACLSEALWRVGARVGTASPPIAALAKNPADLLALVGAAGAVIWRSGRGMPIGLTPPVEALPGLLAWVRETAAPLVTTDRLSQLYAPATAFTDVASGLLALEVSRDSDEYVLWFRPEALQSVKWAGNPYTKAGPNSAMSPRRSFALWQETVRGRSVPWRSAEVENAGRVKNMLMAAASVSVRRLEAMLPICAWCKKVRNEPGYWRAVEEFIRDLVDVRFTHGICPTCAEKQMAELNSPR